LSNSRRPSLRSINRVLMCDSCVQIDERIEEYRRALGKTTDLSMVESINKAITELYADRVRLHKNAGR
jgi:hypothetical protein